MHYVHFRLKQLKHQRLTHLKTTTTKAPLALQSHTATVPLVWYSIRRFADYHVKTRQWL